MLKRFASRHILSITLAGALALLIILSLKSCQDARDAKGRQVVAEGRTQSASEAIEQIHELGERSQATDAEVKEAENAIRQADPADRDTVFRHRICIMQQRTDCDRLLPSR